MSYRIFTLLVDHVAVKHCPIFTSFPIISISSQNWVFIDAEWRPHVTVFASSSVALLQLSVFNEKKVKSSEQYTLSSIFLHQVYLIDLATIGKAADHLIAELLANRNVVKIGVHFIASDFTEFQKQWEFEYNVIISSYYHLLVELSYPDLQSIS